MAASSPRLSLIPRERSTWSTSRARRLTATCSTFVISPPSLPSLVRSGLIASLGARLRRGRSEAPRLRPVEIVEFTWLGTARPPRSDGCSTNALCPTQPDSRRLRNPAQHLMKVTTGLDGGGTVAADDTGRVYVAWHGRGLNESPGEANRQLWIARSTDNGETFATERLAFAQKTGACACCGTRAIVDSKGTAYVLYRAAMKNGVEPRSLSALLSRRRRVLFRPLDPPLEDQRVSDE